MGKIRERITRVTDTLWEKANFLRAEVAKNQRAGDEVELKREPSAQEIYLDEHGRERPSGIPMAPPVGYVEQPPLRERIHAMVLSARLAQEAEAMGAETFEESDDFEVGDDYEPSSPYEEVFEGDFDPGAGVKRMKAIEKEEQDKRLAKEKEARDKMRAELEAEIAARSTPPSS